MIVFGGAAYAPSVSAQHTMNAVDLFRDANLNCRSLEGTMDALRWEDFEGQYLEMFNLAEALNSKGFVYIFWMEREMTCHRGSSNVLRIGETKQTLRERHRPRKSRQYYRDHWSYLRNVIKEFGPIRFSNARVHDHRGAEKRFLNNFRHSHLQYPPFNVKG